MKAWSVAVLSQSPHGMQLATFFLMAPTRGEAIASGVRTALEGHDCPISVQAGTASELDPEAVIAAAEVLATMREHT